MPTLYNLHGLLDVIPGKRAFIFDNFSYIIAGVAKLFLIKFY